MTPPKVKLYGLVPVTRPFYVVAQVITFAILVALLPLAWLLRHFAAPAGPAPAGWPEAALPWLAENGVWLVLAVMALEGLETFVTLRKFARKEAEQKAQLDALDTEAFARRPSLVPPGGYQEPPRSDTDLTTH